MSNQLVIAETQGITFNNLKDQLKAYEETNRNMVFGYEDKKGNKAARSHVAMLRKAKKPINEIHKREKADILERGRVLDAGKRELISLVEEMIEHHDKPLREIKEREEREAEKARIEKEIADCWDEAHTMNKAFDQEKELEKLRAQQEEEQRKKTQKEREERIAKEAADNARRKAEERAKEKERARQRIIDAENAEKERLAADKEHRKACNNAALDAICKHVDKETGIAILTDIVHGEVPFVGIDYSQRKAA